MPWKPSSFATRSIRALPSSPSIARRRPMRRTHRCSGSSIEAWRLSDQDPEVRVVVLRSEGKHFSAGHDMQGGGDPSLGPQRVDGALTVDTYFDWEERGYLHYARRWRDLVKPSIAAVQGKCIAAGLMLCWPCDLIVAADNARILRSRRPDGDARSRVLRPPLGVRSPAGETDPLHRVLALRGTGSGVRHGQRGRAARHAARTGPEPGGRDRRNGPVGRPAGQARRQQRRRRHGFLADHRRPTSTSITSVMPAPSPRPTGRHRSWPTWPR